MKTRKTLGLVMRRSFGRALVAAVVIGAACLVFAFPTLETLGCVSVALGAVAGYCCGR